MGILFTLIVIGVFLAYLISPKVRKEINKSPGITWFGANKYEKKHKKPKYGSDDFFHQNGREWMDRDSSKDIEWGGTSLKGIDWGDDITKGIDWGDD